MKNKNSEEFSKSGEELPQIKNSEKLAYNRERNSLNLPYWRKEELCTRRFL